jgi:hypothetical protein
VLLSAYSELCAAVKKDSGKLDKRAKKDIDNLIYDIKTEIMVNARYVKRFGNIKTRFMRAIMGYLETSYRLGNTNSMGVTYMQDSMLDFKIYNMDENGYYDKPIKLMETLLLEAVKNAPVNEPK